MNASEGDRPVRRQIVTSARITESLVYVSSVAESTDYIPAVSLGIAECLHNPSLFKPLRVAGYNNQRFWNVAFSMVVAITGLKKNTFDAVIRLGYLLEWQHRTGPRTPFTLFQFQSSLHRTGLLFDQRRPSLRPPAGELISRHVYASNF